MVLKPDEGVTNWKLGLKWALFGGVQKGGVFGGMSIKRVIFGVIFEGVPEKG